MSDLPFQLGNQFITWQSLNGTGNFRRIPVSENVFICVDTPSDAVKDFTGSAKGIQTLRNFSCRYVFCGERIAGSSLGGWVEYAVKQVCSLMRSFCVGALNWLRRWRQQTHPPYPARNADHYDHLASDAWGCQHRLQRGLRCIRWNRAI